MFALNQLLFKVNKFHKKRIKLEKKNVAMDILALWTVGTDVLKLVIHHIKWFVVVQDKLDVPLWIKQEVK